MTISAYIKGKESEAVKIEGAIEIEGSTVRGLFSPDVTAFLETARDTQIIFMRGPGGFPITIHDMTKSNGVVLAETARVETPVKVVPPGEQK